MKATKCWTQNNEEYSIPIWSIVAKPDGSEFLASVGNEIIIYNAHTGTKVKSLKGHKDSINALSYAKDGQVFASASSDKYVILWEAQTHTAFLKYAHSEVVSVISHNPTTHQLLSCSATDFAIWTPHEKGVVKTKVNSRIISAAWSPCGLIFAIGMVDGFVSVRKLGVELARIPLGSASPWGLLWISINTDNYHIIIADSKQILSYYTLDGKLVGKEKRLQMIPSAIAMFKDMDIIGLAGTDGIFQVWSTEGVRIAAFQFASSNIKSIIYVNVSSFIIAYENGILEKYDFETESISAHFMEKIAFREKMTEITIHHTTTGQKSRIKCRDLVQHVSMYKNLLAAALAENIIIYECEPKNTSDLHYKLHLKLSLHTSFSFFQLYEHRILLFDGLKASLVDFNGKKQQEWSFDSKITAIKHIGGPIGREACLVGTLNGEIFQLFVNNQVIIPCFRITGYPIALHLNSNKHALAVIDESQCLSVYSMIDKELRYQDYGVSHAAWNSNFSEYICYSGNGNMRVKYGTLDSITNQIPGDVVSFSGTQVHYMNQRKLNTIGISNPKIIRQLVKMGSLDEAFEMACATNSNEFIEMLCNAAIENERYDIAKKCAFQTNNIVLVDILESNADRRLVMAEYRAYMSDYSEAEKLFRAANQSSKALDMYTDLQLFQEATRLSSELNIGPSKILQKQAKHLEELNEYSNAAKIYYEAGDILNAIHLLGKNLLKEDLKIMTHKLKKQDHDALKAALQYFNTAIDGDLVMEIYSKLEDYSSLIGIHIMNNKWEDAFLIAERHPIYQKDVYFPYARWLIINDRFEEAHDMYMKADQPKEAIIVLNHLISNAQDEDRYNDAAYYNWTLAEYYIAQISDKNELHGEEALAFEKFKKFNDISRMFLAYNGIYKFSSQPFTSHSLESLLNMAMYLVVCLQTKTLPQIMSYSIIIHCAIKMCAHFEFYKTIAALRPLAETIHFSDKMQNELDDIFLLSKHYSLEEQKEWSTYCYSCTHLTTLLSAMKCTNCQEPFMYSPITFFNLPLVSFDIGDSKEYDSENPFDRSHLLSETYKRVVIPPEVAKELQGVMTIDYGKKCLEPQRFKNIEGDTDLVQCGHCQNIFFEDEWNYHTLQYKKCILCRKPCSVV